MHWNLIQISSAWKFTSSHVLNAFHALLTKARERAKYVIKPDHITEPISCADLQFRLVCKESADSKKYWGTQEYPRENVPNAMLHLLGTWLDLRAPPPGSQVTHYKQAFSTTVQFCHQAVMPWQIMQEPFEGRE